MQDQEHFGPLAAACDGRAVPGAPAYAPGVAYKLVYFERSAATWVETTAPVPASIQGEGIGDTALVACAADDTTRQVVAQCCFQRSLLGITVPGDDQCMPRVRFSRHVEVRVASTGALLAERDVVGPMPKTCDDWVGRRPTGGQFEAAEPDLEEFAPFLLAPTVPAAVEASPMLDVGADDAGSKSRQ